MAARAVPSGRLFPPSPSSAVRYDQLVLRFVRTNAGLFACLLICVWLGMCRAPGSRRFLRALWGGTSSLVDLVMPISDPNLFCFDMMKIDGCIDIE